jgi:hypothetical protein
VTASQCAATNQNIGLKNASRSSHWCRITVFIEVLASYSIRNTPPKNAKKSDFLLFPHFHILLIRLCLCTRLACLISTGAKRLRVVSHCVQYSVAPLALLALGFITVVTIYLTAKIIVFRGCGRDVHPVREPEKITECPSGTAQSRSGSPGNCRGYRPGNFCNTLNNSKSSSGRP